MLKAAGIACKTVFKVNEGRPNAVDLLKAGTLQLAIYTTTGGAFVHRRKSHPPQRGHLSRPVHYHDERRQGGCRSDRLTPPRSDPRVELAGDSFRS